MRKTVNVNIGSLPFVIDDNAYEALNSYLDDIESRLDSEDSGSMRNIEVRIARLFDRRLSEHHQVVDLDMVRDAMAMIGTPESFGRAEVRPSRHEDVEYIDVEEVNQREPRSQERKRAEVATEDNRTDVAHHAEQSMAHTEPYDYPTHLYRSRGDRVIAGVCGGIAKYANIPVNKIRVTFVVLAIFAGLTLIAYFIMWYLVPEEPLLDVNGNVIDTSQKKEQ